LPWWLTEKGYKAKLHEGRVMAAKKTEAKWKRVIAYGLFLLGVLVVVALKLGRDLLRMKRG